MNTPSFRYETRTLLLAAALLPFSLFAQQQEQPAPPPAPATTVPVTSVPATSATQVVEAPALDLDPKLPPKTTLVQTTPTKNAILLNFQGASLGDVLNYLSEAAGFVIVQDTPVSGTVNVVSRQAVTAEEAVELLNAVLIEKGYIALRSGRILKIVKRDGAQKRDLPVNRGSDPDMIPRKDEMVTQILPVRYGEAAKLVDNLKPLLAENATISANEGANSILLTDTQTNVRRIAQIIQAIDTSVSSISTIRVYPLEYANAKELATVVTQLFATSTTTATQQGGGGRRGFGGFGPGGGGGQGAAPAAAASEARQAAARVIAVADDQSNSLIVSAPDDLIPSITEMVAKIDTAITDVTSTRIFRLLHADAMETAEIITTLYSDPSQTPARTQGNQQRGGQGGRQGFQQGGQQAQAQGQAGGQSQRALLQSRVVAVADPRTNSLLVSAARDAMTDVAEMIGRLDASDSKKQHVYVHSLEHADADGVANVLRGMLGNTTATTTSVNRLTERSSSGASMDTQDTQTTGRSGQ